jgi:autotransporter translocation and assembly factor TamB
MSVTTLTRHHAHASPRSPRVTLIGYSAPRPYLGSVTEPSRARRVALTLAEISLWITTLILALLLTTFVVLGQGWGEGAIHRILTLVSSGFLGSIEVADARIFPDGSVIATNARILDPQGRVIIAVDQVTAHADLWSLARKELHLTFANATGVKAAFAVDEAGQLNIARTFQPRHPQPPSPQNQTNAGNGFRVVIDHFSVDATRVALTIAPNAQPVSELLEAKLAGRFELTPRGEVILSPKLTQGRLRGPLAGNVTVEGRMTLVGPRLTAAAAATLEDTSLQATLDLDLDKLSGVLDPVSLVIGPRMLSTWLGPQKPRGARATLSARLEQNTLRLDAFSLRPLDGPGEITASGSIGLASGDGAARISGSKVDARALLGSLPTSDASFELNGTFQALFGEARSARAHFQMDRWRWDDQLVGPGQLDAETSGRRIRVTNLDLAVPGARMIGQAELSGHSIKGQATVEARNLGQLRSTVESITHVNLPHLEGDAHVEATVDGPFSDLALHANLRSRRATLNGLRSHDLVATLQAPRIGSHMDLQAQVVLGELQVADETFSKIDLKLGWKTPELSLLATLVNRDQAERVWTRLIVPAGFERADLEELELSLPGEEWRLQLPAHLEFTHGVSLKNFRLTSGSQELRLSLEAAADRLQLAAEIQNLDLSRIPYLALKGKQATGFVSGALQYQERGHRRNAQAQLAVTALAIDRIRIPAATLDASLSDSRLSAALDATVGGGKAKLRFEGPLPLEPGLLNGQIEITGLNAADFAILVPKLKPFSGPLALDVALTGTWALPELRLTASAEQLRGPWIEKRSTRAGGAGETGGAGPLSIELQLSTSAGFSKFHGTIIDDLQPTVDLVDLKGTFGVGSRLLGALLRKPDQLPGHLGGAALKLVIKTAPVPLLALGRIVPQLSTARGTAQLDVDVSGAPRALRGSLQLALRDFGFPHRHLGSLDVDVKAEESGLTLKADLTPPAEQGGQSSVTASWSLHPEDLANATLRREALVHADLQATDLPLALLLGRRSDLKGVAKATAHMTGSLGAPSVKAQLALTALEILDKPAGDLDVSADWNGHTLLAKVDGDQPTGGMVHAGAELPLTPAGLGTGPWTGHLQATAFDLSLFEPVLVQTQTVRALSGILNANLSLGGTRAAPEPTGSLSLTEGRLALAGFGEFQHILVSLHVDPSSVVIDRLVANSGGGSLTANLSAVRSGKKDLQVSGHLETKRFGVYVDDQLRAFLSSQSDVSGKMSFPGPGADVTVAVRSASVQIPTLTQRDLAPTTLDPDIHILSWRTGDARDSTSDASPSKPRPPIYLRISAPGPIEVTGPDIQLTAKANLAVRIASDVDLTGLVAVERGEVNALGRTFKIYRANVEFGDGHGDFAPPSSARLDVQAGQEIDGYRITMVVLGRLNHPVPQLSSDPPLPQARISRMLASGSSEGGSDAQSQTGGNSLASNLLVEGMKTWLKIKPPVDVLTVDPSRLEAGKRITPELYVGVTDNYAAVNDPRVNGTEVHARYDLGHNLALDGRYGTSQAGSFDLQWRHNW